MHVHTYIQNRHTQDFINEKGSVIELHTSISLCLSHTHIHKQFDNTTQHPHNDNPCNKGAACLHYICLLSKKNIVKLNLPLHDILI